MLFSSRLEGVGWDGWNGFNQHPNGGDRPIVPATPAPSLSIARLGVPVIVVVPPHGVTGVPGVGTTISGLVPVPPTMVMSGGVIASPSIDPVIVLGSGSPKAALLSEELALVTVPVGLHVPDRIDVPKGEVIGKDALEGGDEDDNPDIPVALLASTAVFAAELMIPVVGHSVIVPRVVPGIGPKFPRLSWMAPRLPLATVGIVPGTAIGDLMGVASARLAGARLIIIGPTWATAAAVPDKSMANIVTSKRCIKASFTEIKFAGTSLRNETDQPAD
jgi:hypothetical protein